MIAEPTAIPGFIIGNEDDPYYKRKRTFFQRSQLKPYLQKRYPEDIKESKEKYTLWEILKLIENTVEKEKLYQDDNPELITGDDEFENAFGPRLMMTTDVHKFVVRQMKTNINRQEKGPTLDTTKLPPRCLPRWATEKATAVKAAKESDISVIFDEDLRVSEKLAKLMNTQNGYKAYRNIFNLTEILDTLITCLTKTDKAKMERKNNTTATITDQILQDALGVTALDVTQLVSLAQYQTEKKPCRRSKSSVKAALKLIKLNGTIDLDSESEDDEEPAPIIHIDGTRNWNSQELLKIVLEN